MRVHHFTATLSPRDAVGHHTLAVDDLLREMGHDTTLFAQSIHPDLAGRARDFRDHLVEEPADVVLYQASTGSPVADHSSGGPNPGCSTTTTLPRRRKRSILGKRTSAPSSMPAVVSWPAFARRAVAAVADSHLNADELVDFGLDDVRGAGPVRAAPASLIAARRPAVRRRCCSSAVLPVAGAGPSGRCGRTAAHRPDARLRLVGASSSARYEDALRVFADLIAPGAVEFAGSVPYEDLVASYGSADVLSVQRA